MRLSELAVGVLVLAGVFIVYAVIRSAWRESSDAALEDSARQELQVVLVVEYGRSDVEEMECP